MKKFFLICNLLSGVFFLLLSGCATVPSRESMAKELAEYNLPKQSEAMSTLVYIVRPEVLGFAIPFKVFVDDREVNSEMGYTNGSQFIYFYVTPGTHLISSQAENWAEITIEAKAGETIFLRQEPSMGVLFARNSLGQIEELEGKYYVKKTKLGTILRERK